MNFQLKYIYVLLVNSEFPDALDGKCSFKKNNKQHQGKASTRLSQSKDQNDSVMVPLNISSPAETVVQIVPR